jgi:hypothetical protein
MIDVPERVRPLFLAAGWYTGRRIPISCDRIEALQSYPLAVEVVRTFGGLRVGTCGPGRDCARSDIEFTASASADDRYAVAT